jgi:hypothetical protein
MLLILVAIFILVALYWTTNRRVENMTDEQTIDTVISSVRTSRPELYPIETVYVEPNGNSRVLFLNMDTYAGELYDYSKTGGTVKYDNGEYTQERRKFEYLRAD